MAHEIDVGNTEYTRYLQLLKKDPTIDGNETFNIKTMMNDNWDKIDNEAGRIDSTKQNKKTTIKTFTSSQNWSVPAGVEYLDIFIIDGGYDGEDGTDTGGGKGGDGGACTFYQNLKVSPNQLCQIVVGSINGGKSSFANIATDGFVNAKGGKGVNKATGNLPADEKSGSLMPIKNLSICPIDGKIYGVSGGGGGLAQSAPKDGSRSCYGGSAGKYNSDKRPEGGSFLYSNYSNRAVVQGGGGASFDNDGETVVADYNNLTNGGEGGHAITYGCGGGGGGSKPAGGYVSYGGSGAPGAVIIAY